MTALYLRNPIFIIGSARSGTTLLAQLIGSHRDVAHWSEANTVWDPVLYPARLVNGQGWWQDNEPRQKEIKAIFGGYQAATIKSRFMNKTPYNTFRIPYLLKMFPEAKIIHIVRDGRAVSYSYALKILGKRQPSWEEGKPTGEPLEFDARLLKSAGIWKRSIEEVHHQDRELNLQERGILTETTYEDLCSDVNQTVAKICRRIDLDIERMGSISEIGPISIRNDTWRSALSDDMIDSLTQAMQPTLNMCGYS